VPTTGLISQSDPTVRSTNFSASICAQVDSEPTVSGSGRRWNGCIAMRPTHGVLPYEGYIPSFRWGGKVFMNLLECRADQICC
jgi:hypothetical protein